MARPEIDVKLDEQAAESLLVDRHVEFLQKITKTEMPTHDCFKMSGIYWTLTALDLIGKLEVINSEEVIAFVLSCQREDGGFGPAVEHDSHILSVLSALQICCILNADDKLDKPRIAKYIGKLQQPDGSFFGDVWGEVDTRFSFCALASLKLMCVPMEDYIDVNKAIEFLVECQNADGGFGTRPHSESHSGQAYCVVGALSVLGQLRRLNIDKASWWLAERQLPSGGLNGRPQKKPDVCYSWWVLASLTMLGRIKWINELDLTSFILASQDTETGGISDRPGDMPDPFHTLFGIAGLSLMARSIDFEFSEASEEKQQKTASLKEALVYVKKSVKEIDPVFCMPSHVLRRLEITAQVIT